MTFFGVFLTLDYDYMCSETDFTQEKSHFHPTSIIPNSSFLFAAALSQNCRIAVHQFKEVFQKKWSFVTTFAIKRRTPLPPSPLMAKVMNNDHFFGTLPL